MSLPLPLSLSMVFSGCFLAVLAQQFLCSVVSSFFFWRVSGLLSFIFWGGVSPFWQRVPLE